MKEREKERGERDAVEGGGWEGERGIPHVQSHSFVSRSLVSLQQTTDRRERRKEEKIKKEG